MSVGVSSTTAFYVESKDTDIPQIAFTFGLVVATLAQVRTVRDRY